MPRIVLVLVTVVLLFAFAVPAGAQGAAISTTLDPSVRLAGMGRASSAVWWGGDPDYWANPALLGYHRGIRYESGETQLVPDLADDVYFRTKRVTMGAYGLGFAFAGQPVEQIGSIRLSYGMFEATDASGNSLGIFEAYEDIDSWGMGLSLGQAIESIWQMRGLAAPAFTRYVDVALGMSHKDVVVHLSPDFGTGETAGETSADDRGLFARVTPYDSFTPKPGAADAPPSVRVRVDLGFGMSTLNRDNPVIVLSPGDTGDPLVEEERTGFSGRVAFHPVALERAVEPWIAHSLSPLVSFGLAKENLTLRAGVESEIDESGWELAVANVLWLRRGHVDDPGGDVEGTTTGWGAGLSLAGAVGFRYDEATVPQATGFDDLHRTSWTIFVDPLRAIAEF